jgi:hypothetical protein
MLSSLFFRNKVNGQVLVRPIQLNILLLLLNKAHLTQVLQEFRIWRQAIAH